MSSKPKMCANCGKLMGVGDECPYCGADNRKLSVRLKRMANTDRAGGMSATAFFIGVNLLLFGVALALGGAHSGGGLDVVSPDPGVLFRLGLQNNAAIDAGQWWRVVTPIFLHLGLLHVAFNCYILWWAGRIMEAEIGSRLFVMMYLLAGIAGFVASYFAGIGGGGASGAVAGLVGAIIVRRRLVDGHFSSPVTRNAIFLAILNAAFGLGAGGINNVAHGVGFVTGAGIAALLTKVQFGRAGAVALMLLTWATAGVTLVAVVQMVLAIFAGGPGDVQSAYTCLQSQVEPAVINGYDPDKGDRALACVTDIPSLESDADDAIERIEKGLRAASSAWNSGDTGGLQQAVSSVRQGIGEFVRWLDEAAPRYGLSYGRAP